MDFCPCVSCESSSCGQFSHSMIFTLSMLMSNFVLCVYVFLYGYMPAHVDMCKWIGIYSILYIYQCLKSAHVTKRGDKSG